MHDDGGQKFVNRLVTLGHRGVPGGRRSLATLCAPLLVPLYAAGEGRALQRRTVSPSRSRFAYWCLPQIFFYALYSLLGEVLNARGVFGPFTWAPVLNNVVRDRRPAGLRRGVRRRSRAPRSVQLGIRRRSPSLPAARRSVSPPRRLILLAVLAPHRPDASARTSTGGASASGDAGRAAGWTFGMVMVTQLAGIVQSNVATLGRRDDPSVAVLRTAWLIFMLPALGRRRSRSRPRTSPG